MLFRSQRRQWHPTPVLLPGKSHGRRSLVGCSPWGRKESDTTERLHFTSLHNGINLPSSSVCTESACNFGELGSIPGWEDPWRRKWQPIPVSLPEKSHRQRSLAGHSPLGRKELDTTKHEPRGSDVRKLPAMQETQV